MLGLTVPHVGVDEVIASAAAAHFGRDWHKGRARLIF
jgi:hypothetical protein